MKKQHTSNEAAWRYVRKPEIVERVGLDWTTLWRMARSGQFVKLYQIGPKSVAARSDELEAWMQARPVSNIPAPPRRKSVTKTEAQAASPA